MSEGTRRKTFEPAVKAVLVDSYLYLVAVDPSSGEPHDLLLSRSQWDVAHDRAIKRISTLPFTRPIAAWKIAILRLLGFHFI